jgi:acyl-CoA dehydrogenase
MRIFDRSILALPFFGDEHRRLAEQVELWVQHQAEQRDFGTVRDIKDRGRYLTRLLGEAGWLHYVTGNCFSAGNIHAPDFRAICLLREGLSFLDDLCDFSLSIQGLASAPVLFYGNNDQRSKYLPDLSTGRKVGSLVLSEPEVGSDLAGIQLRAIRDGDRYVLNGEKTWISNGNIADYHCVFARTGEGPGALGLSCFVVSATTPGLAINEDIEVMAPRPFASLRFRDCFVPKENLIGKAGHGFRYAVEILDRYRTTVGAAAIGFCRKAMKIALEHSRSRKVFNTFLFETQMTKEKLSEMAVFLDAASLLVARAAWEIDSGINKFSKHSSIAKLYATEGAQKVVDDALQLLGAAGTVKGSVTEELYRQIRLLRIYEGTSEIQKLIIAESLGLSEP